MRFHIKAGQKCFAKTRHSSMDLLCTVVQHDNYNVKVELPCSINGITHDVVNVKDIRLLETMQSPVQPEPEPYKPAKPNPFRALVDRLGTVEENENVLPAPEPYTPPPPRKIDMHTLTLEEQRYLASLPECDRQAYMELLLM
jgi:hypothetical protein